jgi:hypothetical protein
MTRTALEHVLRAAAAVSDERDIVVIGSQAILGQFPDAPTAFHEASGYYAHGVDHTTAVLPEGWAGRLVRIENANTAGAVGWCLESGSAVFRGRRSPPEVRRT